MVSEINNNTYFPAEVLNLILLRANLNGRELTQLQRTCRFWNRIINESDSLWKQAFPLSNSGFDRCEHQGTWKEKFQKQETLKRNLANGHCTKIVVDHLLPGKNNYYHLAENELLVSHVHGGIRHYDPKTGALTRTTTSLPPDAFPLSERPDAPLSIVGSDRVMAIRVKAIPIVSLSNQRYLTAWVTGEQNEVSGIAVWSDITGECLFAKKTGPITDILNDPRTQEKVVDDHVIIELGEDKIEVWNITTKELEFKLQIPELNINNVNIHKNILIYFTRERVAHVYDIPSQTEIVRFDLPGESPYFNVNSAFTDKHIIIDATGGFSVHRITDGEVVRTVSADQRSERSYFIVDQDQRECVYYIPANQPKNLSLMNVEDGNVEKTFLGSYEVIRWFRVTQNRVIGFCEESICIWDKGTARLLASYIVDYDDFDIKNNILYIRSKIKPLLSRPYPQFAFIDLATGTRLGTKANDTVHEGLGRKINGRERGVMCNYEPIFSGRLVTNSMSYAGLELTEPNVDHRTPEGWPNRFVIYDFTERKAAQPQQSLLQRFWG